MPVKNNKKRVCVLAMGCGRLASASCMHLRQVGARESARRGRVLPVPPQRWKKGGIPPFDHFPIFYFVDNEACEREARAFLRGFPRKNILFKADRTRVGCLVITGDHRAKYS